MTAAERDKFLALGGSRWFHIQLRKAQLPPRSDPGSFCTG